MTHAELLRRHRAVLPSWLALYYEEPIALVDGRGCRAVDAEGTRYLDFFGGILTTMVGYNLPEVVEAVRDQAGRMVHTSTLYLIEPMIELAERIAGLSGIPDAKVFFTNSGTEANEAALLFATTARRSNQVLALRNSYHGRSFAAMGITGNRAWSASSLTPVNVSYVHGGYRYRGPFRDLPDQEYVRACVDDLRDVLLTTTAGRPVRGDEGGPGRARHPVRLRRGADRLGPHRRALLGDPGPRGGAGRHDLRQGPRQRPGDRRRGGARRPRGLAGGQLHLHLRRQPAGLPRRARHPRLPALPRSAGQRAQGRQPAAPGAGRGRRAPPDRRRRARQGPDDRGRAGRAGLGRAEPAGRGPGARGGQARRPADRQGGPARQRAAHRTPAGRQRSRGRRGPRGPRRGGRY